MWVREGHLRLHRGEDLWAVAMTVARALVGASIPRSSTNWPQCFVPFSKRGKVEREVFWGKLGSFNEEDWGWIESSSIVDKYEEQF